MDNEQLKKFYNKKEWITLRHRTVNSWLKHQRCCSWCGKPLVRGEKHIVDHTLMVRTHWHLRLEPSNLTVMHHRCHTLKTKHSDYNDKVQVNDQGYPPDWQ